MEPSRIAQRARILVVDDEEWGCRTLKKILDKYFDVDIAYSVSEARTKYVLSDYAASIIDYHMPQETGLVLVEEMRVFLPQSCVVLLTADDTLKGDGGGRYTYFEKPLDIKQLTAHLDKVTGEKKP